MNTFDGQVLPGARSSTSNADTTGPVASGVSRAVYLTDGALYPSVQDVDIQGARYRSTLLGSNAQTEYLLWAESSGPLVVAPGTVSTNGTVSIPTGDLTVGAHEDGTDHVVLTDNGGSNIATVTALSFLQGGTVVPVSLVPADYTFDPVSGVIALTTLVASAARGDTFTATYTRDGVRFNWTRNDPAATRFGWNGSHRKWEPFKGAAVQNLNRLSASSSVRYVLNPVPTTPVGGYLPGSNVTGQYAMLRLGATPGEVSYPVVADLNWSGVLVVTDDLATTNYNFNVVAPPLAGVMGTKSGKIAWNPAFLAVHEGEVLWYSPRDFNALSKGVVGSVLDTLYLAPVPSPLERPILRFGQRAPLTYLPVETETALSALTVPPGSVGVALSTGRVKLNALDRAKADPTVGNVNFDPLYLGVNLRYEGVALNRYPQPVQAPVLLTTVGPTRFIPDAPWGLPGTGVSGLLNVPDGTGNPPDLSLPVKPRPVASGLVKRLTPGFGDAFLYTVSGRVANLVTVDWDTDLPTDLYNLPLDTAYVSLQSGEVRVGTSLEAVLGANPVYFVQALVTPALYPDGPRVFSRIRDTFTLGGGNFLFRVDGVNYTYVVPTGTFTAAQVATGLNAVLGAGGTAGVLNGYLYVASNFPTGTVAIGFDEDTCQALGYPPGWLVTDPGSYTRSATDPNWLPDTGLSFGLARSPVNLDGSQDAPDVRATYRATDAVLTEDLAGVPYQLLNYPPREDVAGYDLGVFFALSGVSSPSSVQVQTPLTPFTDVLYQFDSNRFGWLSPFSFAGQVQSPVSSIDLGNGGVVPETFYTVMGGYLRVSATGGARQDLVLNANFLVPEGSGTALLVTRVGPLVQSGYRGTIAGSVLTDTSTTIAAINGDRLKLASGPMSGLSFTVIASTVNSITVTPPFPAGALTNTSWDLYRGVDPGSANGINPAVLADIVYTDFNHLPSEPYEVRLFTAQGVAPGALNPVDLPTANSGRTLAVRFGQEGLEVPVTVLTNTDLGVVSNGPPALAVPTVGTRFTSGAFSLVVGTTVFVNGVGLLPVLAFSPDPGVTIEYLTTTGDLKFGSTVRANYQSASVVYREEVRTPANLPAGTAEVSPFTGDLGVSLVDATANAGATVYLVDLQTFEDVYLNPILGTFTFKRPVEAGQLVLVTYYRAVPDSGALVLADGNPVQVTEFLPVFLRREAATRVNQQLYSFNGVGRTIDRDVNPSIYVGTTLVTYGVPQGVSISFDTNTFSVVAPVLDPATKVLISYAVFEATGGETTYQVSQGPVWRPPFQLTANQSTFRLDTDRTATMNVPGVVLRIGNYLTYLRGATYDAGTDTTTVTVFPTPVKNVGSLAPSDPPINLLTDRPVTPVVDPAGGTPTATTADPWFLPQVTVAYGLAAVPAFQKVTKGQTTIQFDGDLSQYAVVGHLIELFGIPFLIAKSEVIDGTWTQVTLGSPSPVEMTWTPILNPALVRVSVRPVYPELATAFLGAGGFVPTEPFEVVLFEGTNPGVTLENGKDYQLDPGAGILTLLQPRQAGFPKGSSLRFYRTVQDALSPFVFQGLVQYPRVSASAAYIDPPSTQNGRLGAYLTATYTFDSPDSFYARSLGLPAYINETAVALVKGVTSKVPGNNPSVGSFGRNTPAVQGAAGLTSERQDLVCLDRVTRTFLRYFNGVVTSFEQVLENIDGNPVGDRDGKLRLWIGTNDPFTPPGYEDGITSALNPRNIWSDVWNSYRVVPVPLIPSDPVTNPLTATLDANGNPVGQALAASDLARLTSLQSLNVKNDVDDVVLVGLRDTRLALTALIYFQTTSYGAYRGLSEPSPYSRLFPERVEAFTTTVPGIGFDPATGNNGVYSFAKLTLDLFGAPPSISLQSTLGSPIAQLANPVRGNLTSVLGVEVQDRRARARVFGFSPTGYAGVTVRPAFSATVLTLDVFPLTPTGTLDTSGLVAVAGLTGDPDLTTGDPNLHTPPFNPGDQLALGTLDGTTYGLGYAGTTVLAPPVTGTPVYVGVFVDTVIQGTYVTLKTYDAVGAPILITAGNVANLVRLTAPTNGSPLTASMVQRGDTLYVIPTTGKVFVTTPADPPTTAELSVFAQSLPTYRTGMDVSFDGRSGALVDITFPSFNDPNIFGLKEILGQNPPAPVRNLQARVTFQNSDVSPSKIPALLGHSRMDSGDYSLPYYGITPTELSVLGDAFAAGIDFLTLDAVSPPDNPPAPGYPAYVLEAAYPDEVLGDDGVVSGLPAAPAALVTGVTLNPPFSPHSGVGTVQPYDLLFVQEDTGTLPKGATGILTVGAVTYGAPTSAIEPPRFVSQTNTADTATVNITAVQAYVEADPPNAPPHATGLRVVQNTTGPTCITTFELVGIPGLVFDDNQGGGAGFPPVGGFNTYFNTASKNPSIRVNLMTPGGAFVPAAAVYLQLAIGDPSIVLCDFNVSGDNGATTVLNVGPCYFTTTMLTVETALPFFDFAAYGGGTSPAPGVTELDNRDFTIDVIGIDSRVFTVAPDRLTVLGPIDTRRALPRGSLNPTGQPMECDLEALIERSWFVDGAFADRPLNTTINNPGDVNGGDPFTFLPRSYAPFTTSSWGVGGDLGGGSFLLKVMPYEGHKNDPVLGSAIAFSAAPSSRQDTASAILTANAYTDRMDFTVFPHTTKWGDNRFIVQVPELKGSVVRVLPGDVVVIQSASEDPAFTNPRISGKAGAHLVRGVMGPLGGFVDQRQVTYTVPDPAGDYSTGWLPVRFPLVVSATVTDLFVSSLEALPVTQDWVGTPTSQTHVFPPTGRVYVVVDEAGLSSVVPGVFKDAMVSAAYTSLNTLTNAFQGLNAFQDANGVAITGAQFVVAAALGKKVSGFTVTPLNPHGQGVPENLPGYCNADPLNLPFAAFGLRTIIVVRGSSALSWVANATGQMAPFGPPTTTLTVYEKVKQTSNTFLPLSASVYDDVPGALTTDLTALDWDRLHNPAFPAPAPFPLVGVRCFLPGDAWAVDYSGAAGIYVEPSFPKTANNLSDLNFRNVVDAGNTVPLSKVGVRRMTDYVTDILNPGDTWIEVAQLEVRRPRRFHEAANTLAGHLLDLRYNYEIRRGVTTSVVVSGGYSVLTANPVDGNVPPVLSPSGTATQLGNFTNELVNVNPGDEVRFLDTDGTVLDRAEVVRVTGDLTLTLSRKLTYGAGTPFQVYLRRAPVPHEQSNEDLLDFATDTVVMARTSNLVTQTGGKVGATNVLTDTDARSYLLAGVKAGDLLLVDPAGSLTTPTGPATPVQVGRRPYGDNGVLGRTGYSAGSPARADDNRGYYRVTTVPGTTLTVTAIGGLAGNNGADVTFGTPTTRYAIYPTIHASILTLGTEGQMDLRETALPVGKSYRVTAKSVEPFAYRILRPTKLLTPQTVELILAMRERMLSWAEEIRAVQFKYGTYFVFQRDQHIRDLGSPLDPESGLGVLSTAYLEGLIGRWAIAPFTNTRDCLSVLDRRFWVLDFRLDTLTPRFGPFVGTPYADFTNGVGRPVEVDRVNEALDGRDKLRLTRYSWLNLRTDRVKGTLENIRRFDAELPKRQAEAEQALVAVSSVEKIPT